MLLDLVGAAVAAGASNEGAVVAVADAMPSGTTGPLRSVAAALALGATATLAWAPVLDDPQLRPLAVALVRASTGGTRAAASLRAAAADLRDERRDLAAAAARRAGVRAVLPLGVCFLPAFVLLGILPTVVGLASAALVGG
jgi:pilus assembly protein TadC